jgi:hypothetical protein
MSTPVGGVRPQVKAAFVVHSSTGLLKLEIRSERSVRSTTLSRLMSPCLRASVEALRVFDAGEALPTASTLR